MFKFLDDPESKEYKNAVKVARILLATFAGIVLFIAFYFGGDNIKSEESYLKAEVQVRQQQLQQHQQEVDLAHWVRDQQ